MPPEKVSGAHGSVTIDDVARAAGVARATAARALGSYGKVSRSTKDRVVRAAARLGYRPNGLARSLRSGSTGTIGVVIADITNSFFSRSTRGISDVASSGGYELLLVNTDEGRRIESQSVHTLMAKRVDGMIVAPAWTADPAHLRAATESNVHLVLLDRQVDGVVADVVSYDARPGTSAAMTALIAAGHRRIAFVTASAAPDQLITTTRARLDVFHERLSDAGVSDPDRYVRFGAYGESAAETVTAELLTESEPPTALLASDTVIALGALRAIKKLGLRIPNDISLVTVDDAPWTDLVTPALSTVVLPSYAMGKIAADLLLGRIAGSDDPPRQVVLSTSFLARESIGEPPRVSRRRARRGR